MCPLHVFYGKRKKIPKSRCYTEKITSSGASAVDRNRVCTRRLTNASFFRKRCAKPSALGRRSGFFAIRIRRCRLNRVGFCRSDESECQRLLKHTESIEFRRDSRNVRTNGTNRRITRRPFHRQIACPFHRRRCEHVRCYGRMCTHTPVRDRVCAGLRVPDGSCCKKPFTGRKFGKKTPSG